MKIYIHTTESIPVFGEKKEREREREFIENYWVLHRINKKTEELRSKYM